MYDTICEFILSHSEALGAMIVISIFLTLFLTGVSPFVQTVIFQLVGM